MDIKENLANNLIKYRKAMKLTQIELAEKLNYSDKAVSKWERGESVPDLVVLKQIADIYGVTIDTLISPPQKEPPKTGKNLSKKRLIIALCSVGFVWLVATMCFSFINLIYPIEHTWMSFIYAIPISLIVLLIFSSVWGKNLANMIITSLLVWTLIMAIYLTLSYTLTVVPSVLWMVFLIGIPLQVLTLLIFSYNKVK